MAFDTNQLQDVVQMDPGEQSGQRPKTMGERHGFAKWGGLVVLSLALAIIIIDTTILNVAFSTILNDLHTTIENMQWVITAYSLMLAAFTITGGKLGDVFGRKKLFMLGAVIFAVGSFISSISHNVGTLIIGEAIVEGIGAALMLPATSSLLVSNYEGKDRALAFGVWGGVAGASAALGPIIGGYLTTNYSWRWGFRVNIVVVAVLLIGSYLVHEVASEIKRTTLDFVGIALSALGLLSIVFGIIKSSDYGWIVSKGLFHVFGHVVNLGKLSPTPLFLVLGIVFLWFFYLWERHVTDAGGAPLVNLDVFRNRQFMSGAATTAMVTLAQTGIIFTLPVFLQSVLGYSAFHTGIALLPLSVMLLVGSPLALLLARWVQPKRIISLALLMATAAAVWLHYAVTVTSGTKQLLLPLALYGLGLGLVLSQISNITLSAVPTNEAGEASGVNNTFRQIGSTLGSAIIGAVLISVLTAQLHSGIQASTVLPAQSKSGIETAAAAQVSSIEFGNSITLGSSAPQYVSNEVSSIAHTAATNGTRTTIWYTAGFAFLAFLVSFSLPGRKKEQVTRTRDADGRLSEGRMSMDEALSLTAVDDKTQDVPVMSGAPVSPATAGMPLESIMQKIAPAAVSYEVQQNAPGMDSSVISNKVSNEFSTVEHATSNASSVIVRTTHTHKRFGVLFGMILGMLAAAIIGVVGGYLWGSHHEKTQVAATSTAQPGPLYSILAAQPTPQVTTQPLADMPQVLGSSIVAPQYAAPTPASSNSASVRAVHPTTQPTTKTYTYAGANLSITVPVSWSVTQSDDDGTTLTIVDAQGQSHGQLFVQAGVSETLDQKRTELAANPTVSDITDTTFQGLPAIAYMQQGISGKSIVTAYDSNLYTFSAGAQLMNQGYTVRLR